MTARGCVHGGARPGAGGALGTPGPCCRRRSTSAPACPPTSTAARATRPGGRWRRPSATSTAASASCSPPAWPRSGRCCGSAPSTGALVLPSDGYYLARSLARGRAGPARRRVRRCRRPGRARRVGAPGWCWWRRRPTPASTSPTSPPLAAGRARRGRAARRRQHHRDAAGPAPAGAGRRHRRRQRHQGARRARRRRAGARQHPRRRAGRVACATRARARRGPRADGGLARAPRARHPRPAAGAAGRQRRGVARAAHAPRVANVRWPGASTTPRTPWPPGRCGGGTGCCGSPCRTWPRWTVPRRAAAGGGGDQLRRPAHDRRPAGAVGRRRAGRPARFSAGCEDTETWSPTCPTLWDWIDGGSRFRDPLLHVLQRMLLLYLAIVPRPLFAHSPG